MDPQELPPQGPQPQPQFIQPDNNKRPPMMVLFVVLIVVAVGLAYWFFGQRMRQPGETQPVTITGLEVAIKTASFLDTILQPNGSMIGGYSCDTSRSEKCTPIPLSSEQPHVGQAIYSYFLLAEASGNQSYREKSDRGINYVLDACDTNVNMCEWNFFPLAQYYQKTKDPKYLERGMLRPAEKFLTADQKYIVDSNAGHKLASLYEATGDARYLNRLLEIANSEMANQSAEIYTMQVVWSIYLPVYNLTKDMKYLAAAEEFFDNFNVLENIDRFIRPDSVQLTVKGADALIGLYEINGEEKYRQQAHDVLQGLLVRLWDTPENLKFNGDYGFIDTVSSQQVEKAHKPTVLNGWFMKLFVLMKNEKFNEPKSL